MCDKNNKTAVESIHVLNDTLGAFYIRVYSNIDYDLRDKLVGKFSNRSTELNTKEIKSLKNMLKSVDEDLRKVLDKRFKVKAKLEILTRAEEVKTKNQLISNYIKELKEKNILNKWIETQPNKSELFRSTIENGTYKFLISIYELSYKYQVRYRFYVNTILSKFVSIKSVDKNFKTFEDAKKYYDGRKKYYDRYFKEEKPPILKEFKNEIFLHGVRLEGYKIEGE